MDGLRGWVLAPAEVEGPSGCGQRGRDLVEQLVVALDGDEEAGVVDDALQLRAYL